MKDYYTILGIAPSAEDIVIRASYKALAQRYHPDRNSSSSESQIKMTEINEAYKILSDAVQRKAYDDARASLNASKDVNSKSNSEDNEVTQKPQSTYKPSSATQKNDLVEKRIKDASECRCLPEFEFFFYDKWKKLFGDVSGMRHFIGPKLVSVEGNQLTFWQVTTSKRTPSHFPKNAVTHKQQVIVGPNGRLGYKYLTWRTWDGYYDRSGSLIEEKITDGGAFIPKNWKGFETCLVNLPKVREFISASHIQP